MGLSLKRIRPVPAEKNLFRTISRNKPPSLTVHGAAALDEKPGIYSCVPGCCTVSDRTVCSLPA